jgi:DNA-binding transcriptional MerR regulator
MLTAGQVAELLEVTGATLRNYVKWFSGFLSDGANVARGRSFSSRDVAVLTNARQLLQSGLKWENVKAALENIEPDLPVEEISETALTLQWNRQLQDMRTLLMSLAGENTDLKRRLELVEQWAADMSAWATSPARRNFAKPPILPSDHLQAEQLFDFPGGVRRESG